jgi:hypothetical protein
MNKTLHITLGIAASITLAACGANPNSPTAPSNPAPISQNVLQFAVGTANLEGTATALNVVTTYRQPAGSYAPGNSGALLDSVTLSNLGVVPGPAGASTGYDPLATAPTGPATGDIGGTSLNSSSQNPGTTNVTTFGQSGGAFGLGIEPFNAIGPASAQGSTFPGTINSPFQVAPYPVPLIDTLAGDPNEFIPWGGPPAFVLPNSGGYSPVGNQLYPGGTAGVSEGIDVLYGIAPVAGHQYSLTVSVPANTGTSTQTANATPMSVVSLPTPVSPTFTYTGNGTSTGGGTFAGFAVAAPAIEAYVQVTDYGQDASSTAGSCNGASARAPYVYTIETTGAPAALGPNLAPGGAPSVCPGDDVVIQVITFNYYAYESSYPNSLGKPQPQLLPNGQTSADLAIGAADCTIIGGADGSCTAELPLLRKKQFTAAYAKHTAAIKGRYNPNP